MAGTIDHFGFQVSDFSRLLAFYEPVLAALGITKVMDIPAEAGFKGAGFGAGGKPDFWIWEGGRTAPHLHVAFSAPHRAAVDAFYAAALAAGARDNGAPGIRAHYHPNYYAAFVLDPDGHNIEACCHGAE
ncbi:VOC family protein [Mesorhizobium sp. BR1-1-16]|uniref:VOC family protein n=1 Tax=Mesorhizobium sp. BR1-1-16 TaxID=2876653 RepID=UPI001CCABFDB|nr:VOC family protein [Mesorhizobium sp. BR1-1-16]MBZ9937153.1 VOC family protein [Mesorhizobium sp. BR1-1-16]